MLLVNFDLNSLFFFWFFEGFIRVISFIDDVININIFDGQTIARDPLETMQIKITIVIKFFSERSNLFPPIHVECGVRSTVNPFAILIDM